MQQAISTPEACLRRSTVAQVGIQTLCGVQEVFETSFPAFNQFKRVTGLGKPNRHQRKREKRKAEEAAKAKKAEQKDEEAAKAERRRLHTVPAHVSTAYRL